jgi:hypothetical protein
MRHHPECLRTPLSRSLDDYREQGDNRYRSSAAVQRQLGSILMLRS